SLSNQFRGGRISFQLVRQDRSHQYQEENQASKGSLCVTTAKARVTCPSSAQNPRGSAMQNEVNNHAHRTNPLISQEMQVLLISEPSTILAQSNTEKKESLKQKITLLKNDFQKEESRNIDRELALEKEALGFQNSCYLKKAQQLKPNLYDGSVIGKSDVVVTESSAEQAFWSQYSVQTDEPDLFGTTIVEVPKELPKVSMRDIVSSPESAPTFAELFEINDLKAQVQEKDTVILKLKEKLKSFSGDVKERKVERKVEEIETLNFELDHKVTKLVAENKHLKQICKQLFDSIKSSRVQSKEYCDDLINKVNLKFVEVSDLNASLQEKKLVDVAPLVPKLRKNRTAHMTALGTLKKKLLHLEKL
nr:hypothetical protein [Tanacetum cinerariifolium]